MRNEAPRIPAVLAAAILLLIAALTLYLTELSRATAVAILPYALALFGAAAYAWRQGRWPARPWIAIFVVLMLIAIGYGIWAYIYDLNHPPIPV